MLSPSFWVGLLIVVAVVHVAVKWSQREDPTRTLGDELRAALDVKGRCGRWAQARRERRLPLRPVDDLPPPGLQPLIPSPRVVALEVQRGVRELELWLGQQKAS